LFSGARVSRRAGGGRHLDPVLRDAVLQAAADGGLDHAARSGGRDAVARRPPPSGTGGLSASARRRRGPADRLADAQAEATAPIRKSAAGLRQERLLVTARPLQISRQPLDQIVALLRQPLDLQHQETSEVRTAFENAW